MEVELEVGGGGAKLSGAIMSVALDSSQRRSAGRLFPQSFLPTFVHVLRPVLNGLYANVTNMKI